MQHNKPKVSVIVPIFNREKHLERCLNSLVNQTLQDIEIILADDGSKDKSLEICKSYANKDLRIKIIELEHKGVSSARNVGILQSKGEYIGFIDSDDYVDFEFFEKLYNEAIKNNADIAYGGIIRKYKNKEKFRIKITKTKISETNAEKFIDNKANTMPSICNKIYKKEYCDKYNLSFEEGVYYEDKIFVAKALYYANKTVSVPSTNYYYVVNPKSIVKRHQNKKLHQDKLKARIDTLNFIKEKKIELPDNFFCATTKEFRFLNISFYELKESLKSKTHYILGIKIFKKSFK